MTKHQTQPTCKLTVVQQDKALTSLETDTCTTLVKRTGPTRTRIIPAKRIGPIKAYYVHTPFFPKYGLLLSAKLIIVCYWASGLSSTGGTGRHCLSRDGDIVWDGGEGTGGVGGVQFDVDQRQRRGPADIGADDEEGRIPFAFLEDIYQRFVKTYGRAILSASAYAMNEEFSRVLSQQMDHYSNDPNADRLNRLKGEMNQVRNVMIDNIEKVLERGDRLALLVEKTTTMQSNSVRFKRQSRRFKNTLWWRNFKLRAALILIVLMVIYVVLALVCHGPFLASCLK
ncbi:hypothetical protein FNV43_RR04189 [Rhamnella rubrinervis]|uniref:Vesicle-associated membrane protein 7 n=1 Tax=Rhamnella rubrinervis TaxID=2594499 RepID=A0A8K0HLF0_9ROSA|nr:hypothetical protein FNV43_RR04189 [Rhamnella rubrinervis]